MKKKLATSGIGVALAAAAVIGTAAPAQADTYSYVSVLSDQGIYGVPNTASLVNLGQMICNDKYSGYTMGHSASNVYYYHNNTGSLSYSDSMAIVSAANIFLC